tara:strand:+ start:628 stop:948 length:321 start_codon:yes stop_codon:yes gene_type:complete
MGYPEYIVLAWYSISLGFILLRHGEPTQVNELTWLVNLAWPGLLAWGGFYSELGMPQVIYTILWALVTGSSYLNRGKRDHGEYNFYIAVPVMAAMIGLYWWGGFFA